VSVGVGDGVSVGACATKIVTVEPSRASFFPAGVWSTTVPGFASVVSRGISLGVKPAFSRMLAASVLLLARHVGHGVLTAGDLDVDRAALGHVLPALGVDFVIRLRV
jgi:hypothetical protein